MASLSRCAVIFGSLLIAASMLTAQPATVRIRVTDPNGAPMPTAPVSLQDGWGRTVRTQSTNTAGEVLWTNIPRGIAYFFVDIPAFNWLKIAVAVCDSHEQIIPARLSFATTGQVIEVESRSATVETIQMPNCNTLDLPKSPSRP